MCASHMHRIGKGGISVAFGCLFFPLSICGFECAITFQIVVLFVWLLRFRNASFECRSKVTHRIFRQINSMHTQKPHTFPGNRSPIKSSTKKVLPDDYIRVSNIILDQDIKLSDIFFWYSFLSSIRYAKMNFCRLKTISVVDRSGKNYINYIMRTIDTE